MKIAISGKGGVGKTTIAAMLAQTLTNKGFKVLAIDADPSTNLALSLGLLPHEAEKIVPIAENSELIEEKTGVKPESYGSLFRLSFKVDDIMRKFSVESPQGIQLLVMGAVRAAGQGCMCPANTLIRSLLRYLLTKRDEIIIVDLVAGVEHLGRRTAEYVDIMLIVTEASLKSLETAKKINMLSREMGIKKIFGVGNKVLNGIDKQTIVQFFEKNQIPMIGLIPYDDNIRRSDISGVLPLDYENPSSGLTHIISISEKLLDENG